LSHGRGAVLGEGPSQADADGGVAGAPGYDENRSCQ
jgi:hypothetical protein